MGHSNTHPRTPRLKAKVEASQLRDKRELYRILNDTNELDLKMKLALWQIKLTQTHRLTGFK
jgi:hypothetical protein